MKAVVVSALLFILIVIGVLGYTMHRLGIPFPQPHFVHPSTPKLSPTQSPHLTQVTVAKMEISSVALNGGDLIPKKYTCDGEDISPSLTFLHVPQETKELILIVSDPDAPGTFTHWIVSHINPKIKTIAENEVPNEAMQWKNDAGKSTYLGPCPPKGQKHRYFFTLYAVDSALDLTGKVKKSDLDQVISPHIVATADLMRSFHRQQ